jgi:hypothetical protein
LLAAAAIHSAAFAQTAAAQFDRWMAPQAWVRDTDGPLLALGKPGDFDDMHLFAPAVVREAGRFFLWYCGSQGAVAERRVRLGVATSDDGTYFARHPANPVLESSEQGNSAHWSGPARTDSSPPR